MGGAAGTGIPPEDLWERFGEPTDGDKVRTLQNQEVTAMHTLLEDVEHTYEQKIHPLQVEASKAWWDANVFGKEEDYRRKEEMENAHDVALADPVLFQRVKTLREEGVVEPPVRARAVEALYLEMLSNQVDPALLREMNRLQNNVDQAFNTFRANIDGNERTENAIRETLKQSCDSEECRKAWEGSKEVGTLVEGDLRELIKLRNTSAQALGFPNDRELSFYTNEQDPEALSRLFDEFDELTRDAFQRAKSEMDRKLATRFGITESALHPWHYGDPFFQDCPAFGSEAQSRREVLDGNLDELYVHKDIVQLARDFYAGIGLPIDDIIARSDLFEREGKCSHAFSTDIDQAGDVRVLENIKPTEHWMDTTLHEFGHAVYDMHTSKQLPLILRSPSHILTTEAIAMLMGRLSKSGSWQKQMGIAHKDSLQQEHFAKIGEEQTRTQLLIFSRWCQVMFRFEKALYENPDQDLNTLWWDLVEKYQMIRRPEGRNAPDYASKIHIVGAPLYYHNYLLGEMFASQLHRAICQELYPTKDPQHVAYVGNPIVGAFLRVKVFAPGASLRWDELVRYATGEDFNPQALAEDLGTS